jgi:hypothetical protein
MLEILTILIVLFVIAIGFHFVMGLLGALVWLIVLPVVLAGLLVAGLGLLAAVGVVGVLIALPLAAIALPVVVLAWALRHRSSRPAPPATA